MRERKMRKDLEGVRRFKKGCRQAVEVRKGVGGCLKLKARRGQAVKGVESLGEIRGDWKGIRARIHAKKVSRVA